MTLHSFQESEEPSSPCRRRRSLRGESIRSLRELLDETIISSVSSLPDDDLVLDDSSDDTELLNQQQQKSNNDLDSEEEENDDGIIGSVPAPTASEATAKAAVAVGAAGRRRLHADKVRSRLLQNLGIQKPQKQHQGQGGANSVPLSNPPPNNNRSSSSEPWGPTTEIPLNDTLGEVNVEDLLESTTRKGRLQVHFNPTVVVYPIPSFRVYSNRIRQTIWTNAVELQEMVTRNSLEFSYEHWDVARVLDEETGLFFFQGEWIHPVHVDFLRQEDLEEQKRIEATVVKTSDEFWNQTCQRLGIQPAEFYHSLQPTTPTLQKQPTAH